MIVLGGLTQSSALTLNVVRQWPLRATVCKTKLRLLCKKKKGLLYFSVVVVVMKAEK